MAPLPVNRFPLLPAGLEVSPGVRRVRWFHTDGDRFTAPFLDEDLRRLRKLEGNREGGVITGVEALEGEGPAPSALAFHISRCGSTLFSRMLTALPDTLVLSEPRIADDILRAHRNDPAVTEREREDWLRGAFAAAAASQHDPPARYLAKLDCWHLFQVDRVRAAFPHTPLVFLYRNPVEVLVSLARRPSFTLVRGTVTPEELGLTESERDALTQIELAAAILGAFFRMALTHREHLRPLPYPADPHTIAATLPELALTPGDARRMDEATAVHAKEPGRPWVPDGEGKRAAASPELLRAYAEWTKAPWEAWREEIGDPSSRRSGASSGPTGASMTR